MRKLWTWRKNIPRPARIVGNLLLAAVLFFAFYLFRGSPDMSPEQAYRRTEARNLVGPGEILAILDVDMNGGYDRLLLAGTEEGVIQFCYRDANLGFFTGNTFSSYEGDLIYREKEGPVTLMAATGLHYITHGDQETLPLLLFDEIPGAARAEIEFTLTVDTRYTTGNFDSDSCEYSYRLEARREYSGLFVFEAVTDGTDAENLAVSLLSGLFAASGGRGGGIPARVRLYSQLDELLYEGEAWFRSASGAAHLKREG